MATTATFTAYAGHSAATVTVTTQAELDNALATLGNGSGGTILLDGNGGPYDISASGLGGSGGEVLIQSLDSSNQAIIKEVALMNTSYVTIDSVHIDSSDGHVPNQGFDLYVANSDNIEITNSVMTGSANGYLSGASNDIQGNNLALFSNSSNITFSGNTVSEYFHGLMSSEIQGLSLDGNEITQIQGDGMRFAGVQDVTVTNNYIHDFYGSTQVINHSDMIQFWGTNTVLPTQNIEISGNVLDSGSGPATQSIFIRNENLGANEPSGAYFQNIAIFDNTIHNGHWHGITVNDTQTVDISSNTVLWNASSGMQDNANSSFDTAQPWILVANVQGQTIQDNISWRIQVENDYNWGNTDPNNYIINYNNPTSANYADNHIANLAGYQGLQDLLIDPNSPLYGTFGAPMSSDGYTFTPSTGSTGSSGSGTSSSGTGTSGTDTSGTDTSGTDTSGSGSTGTNATDTGSTGTTQTSTTNSTNTSAADDGDDEFFLITILKAILGAIFGGGKSSGAAQAATATSTRSDQSSDIDDGSVLLSDLIPSTGMLEENKPYDDAFGSDDAEDTALAA